MTRKRSDDNEIVNINDMKEKIRILDLTKEYLKKRIELDSDVENIEERAMCKKCKKIKIVKETKIGRLCKKCKSSTDEIGY